MEYAYLSSKHYQTELVPKVLKFSLTNKVKRMQIRTIAAYQYLTELKYEINSESKITFNHLLSLCLYTDYSDLSTDFSRSFRSINAFESLRSVKARNSRYFWMSKYLRECVELFGDYDGYYASTQRILIGPFYCGLSFPATFPYTDISLCSPTSTSLHKEVAMKFTDGGDGIIVEFTNRFSQLHGFKCSWISRFSEESEVIFMGGARKIRIVGVTMIDTRKNYKVYFTALGKFNDMTNGETVKWTLAETIYFGFI